MTDKPPPGMTAHIADRSKDDPAWVPGRVHKIGYKSAMVFLRPRLNTTTVSRLIRPAPYACYVIPREQWTEAEKAAAAATEVHPDLRWHLIRLEIGDQVGWVRSDMASVTILPPAEPEPPTVTTKPLKARLDQVIQLHAQQAELHAQRVMLHQKQVEIHQRLQDTQQALADLYRQLAEEVN